MIAPRLHNLPSDLDVLRGAKAIAGYLNTTPKRVYALKAKGQLPPHFMEGATICARRSTLLAWVQRQESQ